MKKSRLVSPLSALALCGLLFACSDDPASEKDGAVTIQDLGSGAKEMTVKNDLASGDLGAPDSAAPFTISCAGRMPCMACCPNEDEACKDACLAILSEEAKVKLAAMDTCREVTCADACSGTKEECQTCYTSECADQEAACDWGSTGTGTCGEAFACFTACPVLVLDGSGNAASCPRTPGLACIQECYSALSPAGSALFISMGMCMYQQCQTECYSAGNDTTCAPCLETNCKASFDICQGDS